jgi:heptosyltransferase-2
MDTIVVIRLGRLGDVTLTAPTIKNLRLLYPASKILFITRDMYRSLAEMLPGISNVITFPDEGSYFDLVKLCARIDEFEPDLVVDLHKNFRSFHLATLTKAPYRVIYKKRRKERLAAVNDKIFVSPVAHTVDLYNGILDQLKGERLARLPDLSLPEEVLFGRKAVRDAVAIVPGASSPVKAWPTERFARLAERVVYDFKLPVHIFLGKEEAGLESHFQRLPQEQVTIHHNRPLHDIAAQLSQCRMTVTNDSGLMHVSSSVGTPTVAIFGPTHEQLGFYPLGLHDVLLGTDESCRPCSLHGDKTCYREEQYCFTRLTVDSVYDKIAALIDRIKLEPAVFIDRDGTLIEDKHYLADPGKIKFLSGSIDGVVRLKQAGYKIVIVSNQSGVARGFFPLETVDLVHNHLAEQMKKAGCEPDDIRFCPHHPDGDEPNFTGECDCRKPRGGMLEAAAVNLGVDIKRSFIIGDKFSDIQCGKVIGGQSILVRTGKGSKTGKELPLDPYLQPYYISNDLAAAVDYILSDHDS